MRKNGCSCVYATSRNTTSVREGWEMGGYLKKECDQCRNERLIQESLELNKRANPEEEEEPMQCSCSELAEEVKRIATALDNLNRFLHRGGAQ
jgi:hypothetical protein